MATALTVAPGRARLATPADMEAIHRLNYRTFVEEIPQHAPCDDRRLVDRFHDENVYVVYEADGDVVGMVCGRAQRPFSLDQKLGPIDAWLPPHERAVEVRLLAVDQPYRATRVFVRLLQTLIDHFASQGYDLAVLSGTTRQLALYANMGCVPFAHRIGSSGAEYQPMYLDLETVASRSAFAWNAAARANSRGGTFLPGPVAMHSTVVEAFATPAASHRADAFLAQHARVRAALCARTGARHATLLLGSGTLANDIVGSQLAQLHAPGVVLTNGEFGDRLADHALRLGLSHTVVRAPWGAAMDWGAIDAVMAATKAQWLWAVHSETSTGVVNDLDQLLALSRAHGAKLALDAISSLGAVPVDLRDVWMASAVSGKALASYPGVAIVLHQERPAPCTAIPRYLDLGHAIACGGVPFTQSSNLVAALDAALGASDWPARFAQRAQWGQWVRAQFESADIQMLAPDKVASPVVQTLVLPPDIHAADIGFALRARGYQLAFESEYLRARNWMQLCLMGEVRAAEVRGVVRAIVEELRKPSILE